MNLDALTDACTISLHKCGFYHPPVRPCPQTHHDDAMNRRCNMCEHLVRQCICEWGQNKPDRTQ